MVAGSVRADLGVDEHDRTHSFRVCRDRCAGRGGSACPGRHLHPQVLPAQLPAQAPKVYRQYAELINLRTGGKVQMIQVLNDGNGVYYWGSKIWNVRG